MWRGGSEGRGDVACAAEWDFIASLDSIDAFGREFQAGVISELDGGLSMLDTTGVVTIYTIWFTLTFVLAAVLVKINSKK